MKKAWRRLTNKTNERKFLYIAAAALAALGTDIGAAETFTWKVTTLMVINVLSAIVLSWRAFIDDSVVSFKEEDSALENA